MLELHSMFFLGLFLLLLVFGGFYGFTLVLDWILIHENEWKSIWSKDFAAFAYADLRHRVERFVGKWVQRGKAWSRTAWWFVAALGGAFAIAAWIGGTEYLQSWAASVFRVCSGAAVGYLISRFLLRIDVSAIAELYPDGSSQRAEAAGKALIASSLVIAAASLAVALGM